MKLTEIEARQLSKMLFGARESIEMWADVVAARAGEDEYTRGQIDEIDAFRAHLGWNLHGFGNESAVEL